MSEKNKQETKPIIDTYKELDSFVFNPGLDALAKMYGAEDLPTDRSGRLAAIKAISDAHWDFRKGAERQDTDWEDDLLDQEDSDQWRTIFEAADQLGMVQDSEPANTRPSALVILGGANKAPLHRLQYGLEKVDDFGLVAYLGSSRPLSDKEKENVRDYAPEAETEFDLGCAAIETFEDAQISEDLEYEMEGQKWKARLYEFTWNGQKKHAFILNTPYQIGERRANTRDNYNLFSKVAELDKNEDPDYSIVAVTTGIYVPAQHLKAVGELVPKYDLSLETIGHSASYSGVTRKPRQLLQELKAAIDAAAKLEKELEG